MPGIILLSGTSFDGGVAPPLVIRLISVVNLDRAEKKGGKSNVEPNALVRRLFSLKNQEDRGWEPICRNKNVGRMRILNK